MDSSRQILRTLNSRLSLPVTKCCDVQQGRPIALLRRCTPCHVQSRESPCCAASIACNLHLYSGSPFLLLALVLPLHASRHLSGLSSHAVRHLARFIASCLGQDALSLALCLFIYLSSELYIMKGSLHISYIRLRK